MFSRGNPAFLGIMQAPIPTEPALGATTSLNSLLLYGNIAP
jgi:hypothetical protein